MIVGLLHQRVMRSLTESGIINPPTFVRTMSDSHAAFYPQPAEAGVSFEIKRNGTWVLRKTHNTFGSPVEGNWALVLGSKVGDDFSVQFEIELAGGDPSTYEILVNGAPGWSVINQTRQAKMTLKVPANDSVLASYVLKVSIRNNKNGQIVTGYINVNLSADQNV